VSAVGAGEIIRLPSRGPRPAPAGGLGAKSDTRCRMLLTLCPMADTRLPADWTATQWRGPARQLDEARAVARREGLTLAEVLRLALGSFLDAVNAAPIAGRCGRCGRQLGACECRLASAREKVPA
jgi:hypothetical protein